MSDEIIKIMQEGFDLLPMDIKGGGGIVKGYLASLCKIESTRSVFVALKKAYTEHFDDMIRKADAEKKSLEYVYGLEFRNEADILISKQRKDKSVRVETGTVGYRTQPDKLVITEFTEAASWAANNLPDAINGVDVSIVLQFAKDNILTSVQLAAATTSRKISELEKQPHYSVPCYQT